MQENGKTLPIRSPGNLIRSSFIPYLDDIVTPSNSTASVAVSPSNLWFGRAVAQLLECGRCYLAVLSPGDEAAMDEVRIGCTVAEAIPPASVVQIASHLGSQDNCIFQSVAAANGFARKLIGWESTFSRHCVIGRLQSRSGTIALFVAGWRRALFSLAEFASVVRAIELLWDATDDWAQMNMQENKAWLEEIIPPALLVDENLSVLGMNSSCQQFLNDDRLLLLAHGVLAGSNSAVTARLKEAVQRTIAADPAQRFVRATVALSGNYQKFAFAIVGKMPTRDHAGMAFIYVPQFDERAGARRIAAAFELSWVEERIVSRILRGLCPRLIGAELGFTEETVRTYTKRIMLKVGINRQSEFFVLHSLTFAPFKMGQKNQSAARIPDRIQVRTRDTRSKAS
ncbi:MAG: hypothetical protein BGP05_21880 [Rhizobiales bacterium 62-47]|nr:helix-turn-helix transcriptional regulator [Hyphomicrobiales bacterium]OJY10323.1 MAG: hypothetical protein BGP05_21880 [Rhizobiales bacterium 62-47]